MTDSVSIEQKLGVNKFHVNENSGHIEIDAGYANKQEIMKLIKACPAGLYKLDDHNVLAFDYAGCLECGTCRVLSKGKGVTKWDYPDDGFGIEYRLG